MKGVIGAVEQIWRLPGAFVDTGFRPGPDALHRHSWLPIPLAAGQSTKPVGANGRRWYNLTVIENEYAKQQPRRLVGAERNEEVESQPPSSLGERTIPILIASLIVVVDHLTKLLVESLLPLYSSWTPFPDWLPFVRITHVSNTGAAFGIFPEGSSVFMIAAIIVSAVIILYNFQLPAHHRLLRLALGLQLGGALGNLIDRFRLGYVTDFVDIGPWAVFNVADLSIVSGVVVLGFMMLLEQQQGKRQPEAGDTGVSAVPENRFTGEE